MGTVFLRSLTTTVKVSTNFCSKQSFKMAVRFLVLASLAVLASVDFVSADGDNFWGANCGLGIGGSDKCLKPISYCDRSVKSVAKAVAKNCLGVGFHPVQLPHVRFLPVLPLGQMPQTKRGCLNISTESV